MISVKDVRDYFVKELKSECYTTDKTGARTIEMIGASFVADEPSIFGVPNDDYISQEMLWYTSMSTNIKDIYGEKRDPPAAWRYAANQFGEINSNYGLLMYSEKYYSQFERALDELIENPDGRRATMIYNRPSIWVEHDENGKSDFICTNAVTYYIRNNLLHCVVQMRSNDVVYGYKNDWAWQNRVMNDVVLEYNFSRPDDKIELGTMVWQVQNLHVYERHFDLVVDLPNE